MTFSRRRIGFGFRTPCSWKSNTLLAVIIIITNPPWDRTLLHPLIEKLSDLRPTWLLFDADWVHTKQSINYLPRLRKIVSIGRVKWFDKTAGKDNSCWYLFDKPSDIAVEFYGRKNPQA
jgi:hypothetical protein